MTALQQEKAGVAILYSLPSMVYDSGYPDMLGKAYEAISLSGLKTGFVTEKQVQEGKLDDYRMVIVPKAGHIQADTLNRLKLYADNGGKIVVLGGDSLRFDEHNQSLSADIRGELLGKSNVLDSISSADQLRGLLLPMFTALQLNRVMLYDAATGEPVKDVEWRSVKVNNTWLINIDNYSAQPKTVYVQIDNKAVTAAAAELIEGTTVNNAGLTLQPLKPVLLSLAVEEVTDETPPTTTAALDGFQRNGWYVSGGHGKLARDGRQVRRCEDRLQLGRRNDMAALCGSANFPGGWGSYAFVPIGRYLGQCGTTADGHLLDRSDRAGSANQWRRDLYRRSERVRYLYRYGYHFGRRLQHLLDSFVEYSCLSLEHR